MSRLNLHTILKSILPNVYFQPPESVKLTYPCIVYSRSAIDTTFAANRPYNHITRYSITLIDKDPDSEHLATIASLPMCKHERHFTAANLNHDVFNLYY